MTDLIDSQLCTIAQYRDPYEAELARSVLESEGIPAYLHSVNHVSLNWLTSNAIGGVRLQVPAHEVDRALARLREDHSAELEEIEETSDEPGPEDLCPACHSDNIRRDSFERTTKAVSMLFGTLLVPLPFAAGRFLWKCEDCGHSFRQVDPRRHWAAIAFVYPWAVLWALVDGVKTVAAGVLHSLANRCGLGRSELTCWSCGASVEPDATQCSCCEIPLPSPELYRRFIVRNREYDAACPSCHVPYRRADYAEDTPVRNCAACGHDLDDETSPNPG